MRRLRTRLDNIPPPTPEIERVTTMKILGVVYAEDFTCREQVERMVTQRNRVFLPSRHLGPSGSEALICGMITGLPL